MKSRKEYWRERLGAEAATVFGDGLDVFVDLCMWDIAKPDDIHTIAHLLSETSKTTTESYIITVRDFTSRQSWNFATTEQTSERKNQAGWFMQDITGLARTAHTLRQVDPEVTRLVMEDYNTLTRMLVRPISAESHYATLMGSILTHKEDDCLVTCVRVMLPALPYIEMLQKQYFEEMLQTASTWMPGDDITVRMAKRKLTPRHFFCGRPLFTKFDELELTDLFDGNDPNPTIGNYAYLTPEDQSKVFGTPADGLKRIGVHLRQIGKLDDERVIGFEQDYLRLNGEEYDYTYSEYFSAFIEAYARLPREHKDLAVQDLYCDIGQRQLFTGLKSSIMRDLADFGLSNWGMYRALRRIDNREWVLIYLSSQKMQEHYLANEAHTNEWLNIADRLEQPEDITKIDTKIFPKVAALYKLANESAALDAFYDGLRPNVYGGTVGKWLSAAEEAFRQQNRGTGNRMVAIR